MRTLIAKFATLAFVGLMAIGAVPVSSAQAQTATTAQIDAAVLAAASGTTGALAALLASYPGSAVTIGDAVAGTLNAGGPGSQNLANALVATNNVSLIAGVMIAGGITPTAQTAIANAVSQSPNAATLGPSVVASVQLGGGSPSAVGAIGALASAGLNTNAPTIVLVNAPPIAVPTVIIPSPATLPQTGSTH